MRRANPHLRHGPDQDEWADRIAEDYDNVRAAITFGLEHAPEVAAEMIGNLAFFFWFRGGFATRTPRTARLCSSMTTRGLPTHFASEEELLPQRRTLRRRERCT